MVTIAGKALGRKKPLFADFSVTLPSAFEASCTLRQLLDRVVRGEVESFHDRQAERRLLKVLSSEQIAAGLAKGKVDSGGSELNQEVDPDTAVANALEAFGDGLYMVVVDDVEIKELDAPLSLQAESRLTFIRLTMLAGG